MSQDTLATFVEVVALGFVVIGLLKRRAPWGKGVALVGAALLVLSLTALGGWSAMQRGFRTGQGAADGR
jgi:hypothetical protein